MNEAERKAFKEALIEDLVGMTITVSGPVNEFSAELTRDGVIQVLDRLKARDYKVIRPE